MKLKLVFFRSIITQATLIIAGFALVSLVLTIFLYRQSMRTAAIKEVENKATIFLASMETPVRRLVNDKETKNITELLQKRGSFLSDHLNFAIVRAIVWDAEGTIIDHSRVEKIGDQYTSDDFRTVQETKRPHITRQIKTLKREQGQPDIPVIEVSYPIFNRQNDLQAIIKIIISLNESFAMIKEDYHRFSIRVMAGFTLTSLFMVIATLIFLRRRIILPIVAVSQGAGEIAKGDLDVSFKPSGSLEIQQLLESFHHMVKGLRQREEMQKSLQIAMEVQQSLLPNAVPQIKGLDIAGRTIYCDETGGDYFDFIELGRNRHERAGIVVADVSGHGISSALLMASARASLRQRAAHEGRVDEVISDVNYHLTKDVGDTGNFITMFYLVIDSLDSTIHWVRAGHDPAILFDPATDSFTELKGNGVALGLDTDWQYEENSMTDLQPSQILFLATDGIYEARNSKDILFGKDRVLHIIRENYSLSSEEILQAIEDAVSAHRGDTMIEDDMTMVVVKINSLQQKTEE